MANFIEVTFLDTNNVVRTERYSNFTKAVREVNKIFGREKIQYNTVKRMKMPFEHNGVQFRKLKIQ